MKKILFLFVSFLYVLTGKAALTDVLTDQMYTPEQLLGATSTQRIALRCVQVDNYNTYYNGSGRAAFGSSVVMLLEPVTEGTAGTYYLRLANPTEAQGENCYFGPSGPGSYVAKANARPFTIVHPVTSGYESDLYRLDASSSWSGMNRDNLVRFVCPDGTNVVNQSQTGYNQGRGIWTVFEVYKVEQQDVPTIETISTAIATEEEFVNGGKYIIHGAGATNAYFYEKDHTCEAQGIDANTNKRIGFTSTMPAVGSTDFRFIFTLEKEIVDGVAQYAFRTNSGGYIDGVDHGATSGGDPIHTTETKCTFTMTRDGSHWRVNSTATEGGSRKQWNTGSTDTYGLVLFAAGDANGIIDFYEVNHNTAADKTVSFSYYSGSTLLGVENKTFAAGTPVSVTVPDYVEITSTDPADLSTVADGGTVNVYTAMKADCPFKVSEAAEAADAVWMNWQIQRSPAKWVYAADEDAGVKVTAAATQLEADRYQWCMVGDWYNGFTLYNKYSKKQIAATAPAANNGANTLTLAESGTSRFALVQNGTDYYFQLKGAENTYISNYSNNNVTDLYVWRSTSNIGDGGSKFAVVAAPTEETILADWQVAVAAATEGNYVNCYTAEAKAAAAAATTIAEAKTVKPVAFDVNSYYRIISVSPKNAGTSGQGAATMNTLTFDGLQYFDGNSANKMLRPVCAEASEQNIGQIWQFKATGTEGVYTLYNPNAAQYVGGVTNVDFGRLKMADTGDELELVPYAAANHQFKIHHYGTGDKNCMFAENNTSNGYTLSNWELGANSASAWYLLPVSTFKVALNAAGTDYWASLYLPFDATLPASGLEAYYGKAQEGGALKMEQATAVPANQGVVLKGTADTYTLSIAAAAVTPIESNVLQGTNKLLEGITSDDYYTLGAVGGAVGFYHPSATQLKANRAYLPAVGGGVNAFTLVFDEGTETGISQIETVPGAADVYYDLSGRRIATPGKGLYIKNGKKVLVK